MHSAALYRSNRSKIIAGVMGGIAERFAWNANVLRVVFILVSIFSAGFPGILIYLILWFVIPKQPYEALNPADEPHPIRTIHADKIE